MKHIFLSIALLLAGAALFAQSVSFSSADLDKNKITDEIFSAADVTVVNVWGTFCPPCIREMPELAEWQKSMPKNVQIIGIVCDVNSTDDAKGNSQKSRRDFSECHRESKPCAIFEWNSIRPHDFSC